MWRIKLLFCVVLFILKYANGALVITSPASLTQTLNIDEDIALGTVIQAITSTSANLPVTWTLAGTDAADFNAAVSASDSRQVSITLKNALDFETTKTKTFTLTGSDTAPSSVTITYNINVVNKWDIAPTIPGTVTCSFVEEDTTTTCDVTVIDAEISGSSDAMQCILSGAGSTKFTTIWASPQCKIKAASVIDRDITGTVSSYPNLRLTVKDNGNNEATAIVTILITDLNDNKPTCTQTSVTKTVAETYTGLLTKFTCNDPDDANNGQVVCSVDGTDAASVIIDSSSCELTLPTAIDYETKKVLNFNVLARDNDINTANRKTTTITYTLSITDVYDIAPVFTGAPYSCSIVEETTSPCSLINVADVETAHTPPDAITCTLSGPNSIKFSINPASCVIQPVTGIDRDVTGAIHSFPNLILTATDKAGNSATASISVSITDQADTAPTCGTTQINIAQAEGYTGSIATLSCTDTEGSTTFGCSINPNPGTKLTATVTGKSCLISIATAYDYETGTYPLGFDVLISNTGTPTLVTTVSLSLTITGINDEATVWGTWIPAHVAPPASTKTILENVAVNTLLYTVVATDADKDTGSAITYSILSAQSTPNSFDLRGNFIISPNGEVKIAASNFDIESYSTITVTVKATDGTTALTRNSLLTLSDVNEFAPVFNPVNGYYTAIVNEGDAVDTDVITLVATDPDKTATVVQCSIVASSDANSVFKMDATNKLKIKLNKQMVVDKPTLLPTSYSLNLNCFDTALTATATVQITVPTTSNDFTPVVTPATQTVTVQEGSSLGSIASFTASDQDTGPPGTLTCSLSVPSTQFAVSSGCDKLNLIKALDYETATSHTINIAIRDNGTPIKSVTTVITVTVTNKNDNDPQCTQSTHSINRAEQAAPATPTTIYIVPCSDADEPTATTNLAITSGDPTNVFRINNGNELQLVLALDYETVNSYILKLEYTESAAPNKKATMTVYVTVDPVNEATPAFPASPTPIQISEASAVNSNVGPPFTATDSDTGGHGIVSYTLQTHKDKFAIANNAQIRLIKTIDYETMGATKFYVLDVKAVDGGGLSSTGTLTVSILDANENAPVCDQAIYTSTIAENIAAGTSLVGGNINAPDNDATAPNNQVKYSIASGDTSSSFTIDAATGQVKISTTAGVNYEAIQKYTLLIDATDGNGAGPNSATCTLSVTVTDLNEFNPTFVTATASADVNENNAVGSKVYKQGATDADTLQTLTYTIAPSTHFTIDSTGQIYLGTAVNFESGTTSYALTITATDNGSPTTKSGTYNLNVNVKDYNEFAPTCDGTTLSGSILENAAVNDVVGTLSCSDLDTTSTLTYHATTAPFTMSSNKLVLNSAGVLDYESATKSYTVPIEVRDTSILPVQTTTVNFIVTVLPFNEFDPVFTLATSTFTFSEDKAVNYLISTITATDADQGSNHATLTYSILSGNTAGKFSIDSANGKLTLANTIDFDTETKVYPLVVKALDGGGRSGTVSVTVSVTDINDITPVGTPNPIIQDVMENAPNNSVAVDLTSAISDGDSGLGGQVTVTIASGNTNSYFKVVGKQVQVNMAPLNAVAHPVVTLVLTLTDGGTPTLSSSLNVQLNIKDVNLYQPQFTVTTTTVTIPENTAVGFKFYTATATDADGATSSGNLEWSLDAASNPATAFTITTTNGEIRIFSALDRETTPVYNLIIILKDKGTPVKTNSMTLTITVTDINDNDPVFPPAPTNEFTKTIPENSGINYAVTTVKATDQDDGVNKDILYSILSQSQPYFAIDAVSGILKTTKDIDRETFNSFSVRIKATDKGATPRFVIKDWIITISDLNDNDPVFGQTAPVTVAVFENQIAGTAVTSTPATDKDIGTISYSLVADSPTTDVSHFAVDTLGNIVTAVALNRENIPIYNFYVVAKDSGPGVRSASLSVIVTVSDVNDNAPVIVGSPVTLSVAENSISGQAVGTLTVSDADAGVNAQATMLIVTGNTGGSFSLNDTTFQLSVSVPNLDYETLKLYTLLVRVVDKGVPPMTSTGTVIVQVTDSNDNACKFSSSAYIFKIVENQASGVNLVVITASDIDQPPNNVIKYRMGNNIFGDGLNYLTVNENSGVLKTTANLINRELTPKFIFTYICYDNTASSLSSTTTVTVEITDQNDNIPVQQGNYTNVNVNENVPVGFAIIRLNATDSDSGVRGTISYSMDTVNLDGVRANQIFQLHSSTGLIMSKVVLDRETDHILKFNVVAQDAGSPVRSTTISVTITIRDMNDNIPIVSSDFYSFEVAYNITNGYTFGKVSATDKDQGANGTITYSWDQINSHFNLGQTTGDITRQQNTILNPGVSYIHIVISSDAGTPQQSVKSHVRIDTFDPAMHTVSITLTTPTSNFQSFLPTVLRLLKESLNSSYPNSRVGYMHTITGSAARKKRSLLATQTQAYYYAVANTEADSLSGINKVKSFIPNAALLSIWRNDASGTPTGVLLGSNFGNISVDKVQSYIVPTTTTQQWYETGWGIAVIVLAIVLFLVILGIIIGCCVVKNKGSRIQDNRRYVHDYSRNNSNLQPNQPQQQKWRSNPIYKDSNPYGVGKNSANTANYFNKGPGQMAAGRTITPVDVRY